MTDSNTEHENNAPVTPANSARARCVGGTGRAVVVGGGLAGLMATLKLTEAGIPVDLFSVVPAKRSHSVCAQGGINAVLDTKGEGDTVWEHIDDTIYGGDFLANQTMVARMCEAAPAIVNLFDRMGVMFNRTPEGLLDLRRFGGTQKRRTAFAGATTGQQLLYALDEQVRAQEVAGMVRRYEFWTFVSAILDEGVCKGIVAQDLASMEIRAFPADAVVVATGGCGAIFGKSTNSTINTGYVAAKLYTQGALYANGEFIQIHPTAIPGADKNRLMSESARGEGGRVWTYKDGKPWYFLEEKYPAYGNLVPRDIATREIYDVIYNQHLGVNGENVVYLDVSHIDPAVLDNKLGGILEIYEKFVGDDPRKVPMRIAPSVHYSMGGLWVDVDQSTNIPGLFAAGECEAVGRAVSAASASAACGTEMLPVPPSTTEKPAACGSTASAPIVGCSSCRNEGMVLPWSATGVSPGTKVEASSAASSSSASTSASATASFIALTASIMESMTASSSSSEDTSIGPAACGAASCTGSSS